MTPELSIALAALASLISHALRDSKLPRWLNIVIALAAFILCTIFTYWVTQGFTGNIRGSILPLIAFGVGLAGKELFDLLDYIKGVSSPLAAHIRAMPAIQRRSTLPPPKVH